jgi:hypothetical protein
MGRILAILIDLAPKRWWKVGNYRQVGSHDLHFCFDNGWQRTIEWDGREIASGRRTWELPTEG